MTSAAQDEVERRLHDARLRLAEATGGAALCRIDADAGDGLLAVKRAEGAAAALADLRHALRGSGDFGAAVRGVGTRWRDDLESHRARGSGDDWVAYFEGGISAIADMDTWTVSS